MNNRRLSLRARVMQRTANAIVLPPLQARALANLPPAMARYRPPLTPIARSLRDSGMMQEDGQVGSFDDAHGAGMTNLRLDFPAFGGQGVTLPLDLEAARYLPPRTRVRLTLEILGPEEE